MSAFSPLPFTIAAEVVHALATASDPSHEHTLKQRREALVSAIGQLIGADVWLWVTGESHPTRRGDAMVTSVLDSGFRNDHERAEFLRVIVHPELAPLVTAPVHDAMATRRPITRSRSQLISSRAWKTSPLYRALSQIGFHDFILSVFPVGQWGHSGVGFHRRLGTPTFGNRERSIVQLTFENIRWLHDIGGHPGDAVDVVTLSPRERHVMLHLMNGDSRKQVARKIRLSEHTVNDHLKEIYRKFDVSSREELLAKFIAQEADL